MTAPTSSTEEQLPSARTAALVCAVSGVAFAVLAAVLVPWDWLPGGAIEPVSAASVFTSDQIAIGERVSGMLRHTGWASLAVSLLVSVLLGLTRAGGWLVGRLPGPWVVKTVLAVGAVTVIGSLATLPFGWRAQQIDLDYGLSRQSWSAWLIDRATGIAVVWVFTSVALVVLMALARRAPRTWPAWCAGIAAVLAFAGSYIYPVVVEPLFNDFTSMPAGQLRSDIFALADKEGVHIDDVLVADASRRTTTLNAYVSGIGNTKRVVVYDNLLDSLSDPEIESVVAHELAHTDHHDVLVGTTLASLGAGFGIGLLGLILRSRRFRDRTGGTGLGDPRLVPAVLALAALGTFFASPVENTISRAVEARADRSALESTGESDAFIRMQKQLALRSLADPTPPWFTRVWFRTHPTVLQRIALAQAIGSGNDSTVDP